MKKKNVLVYSTLLSLLVGACNLETPAPSNSDSVGDSESELSSSPIDSSISEEESIPSVEESSGLNSSFEESSPSEEEIVESSSNEIPEDNTPVTYTLNYDGVSKIYNTGEHMTVDNTTWTNYLVVDEQGRIVYTVANVGCGYGRDNNYYSHPAYHGLVETYFVGNDFVVPEGCTGYSISYEEYGMFMYTASNGVISSTEVENQGYGDNVRNWNSLDNIYLRMQTFVEFEGYFVDESFDFSSFGLGQPTVEEKTALPSYTPTTFSASTYSTKTTSLGDGVDLVVATYKLSNGSTVKPHAVVVDLNKANIVAGTTNDSVDPASYYTKGTPSQHASAYEANHPGIKVLAATNADFFGTQPVNAFVKDGVILKAAHNSDVNDVPVSRPMLFGVSKAGARIGSMTNLTNYADNQNAALTSTGVSLAGADGTKKGTFSYSKDSRPSDSAVSIITTLNVSKSLSEGSKVYKFKKIQTAQSGSKEMRACIVARENVTKVRITDEKYGYLIFGPKFKGATMNVGDYLVTNDSVYSKDGMWDYYDTIIGARHSLIENGKIPATVSSESSNGAKARVPRTAVGIMSDGKVVIVSVEDVHYGGKSDTCTGLTLSQLADFMRYFGCYDAANFDGGGSSQLIAREGYNGSGAFTVRTKSSDTNSTTISSTRKVVNSILVTTKE